MTVCGQTSTPASWKTSLPSRLSIATAAAPRRRPRGCAQLGAPSRLPSSPPVPCIAQIAASTWRSRSPLKREPPGAANGARRGRGAARTARRRSARRPNEPISLSASPSTSARHGRGRPGSAVPRRHDRHQLLRADDRDVVLHRGAAEQDRDPKTLLRHWRGKHSPRADNRRPPSHARAATILRIEIGQVVLEEDDVAAAVVRASRACASRCSRPRAPGSRGTTRR